MDTVEAIIYWVRSTNLSEVQALLGFVSYYRRIFKNFAALAKSLSKLTAKKKKFLWRKAQENAFSTHRKMIFEAPVLAYPYASKVCNTRHRRQC